MRNRNVILALLVLCLSGTAIAQNNGIPGRVRSAALLEVIADKGLSCGLLQPWAAVAVRAMNQQDTSRFSPEQKSQLMEEVSLLAAESDCNSPAITGWISGASQNFDSEVLPPYLIIYKTLAMMDPPPKVFSAITLRQNYDSAITSIDSKLDELEASGRPAEGGRPWPEYIARIENSAAGFVETLTSSDADGDAD